MNNKEVKNISIEEIMPNRFQPRLSFDEEKLIELAASIKEHGIIQPLILRRLGDKYEIIAGERRYKAAIIAGLNNVPAIITEKTDNESAEMAIVENIQRRDLTAIEEAKSYQRLIAKGLTQEDVAKKLGISQSTVANKIRLLSLTEEVQNALLNGKISERHARGLLRIENPIIQIELLNRIINEKLTVKQTDEEIDKLLGIVREKPETPILEEKLDFAMPIESEKILEKEESKPEVISFSDDEDIEVLPDFDFFDEPQNEEKLENPVIEYKEEGKDIYLENINKIREYVKSLNSEKIILDELDLGDRFLFSISIEK